MLASMLMESALGGVPNATPEAIAKYTHEDGAALIAMETAEDIHEIFLEGFYSIESLEFDRERAAMEGAPQDVLESIAGKIKKKASSTVKLVKEKIQQLWEKVKGFVRNTKTYIMAIFQNGSKFAKAHQAELKALNLDSGFTYDLYDYNIKGSFDKMTDDIATAFGSIDHNVAKYANPSAQNDMSESTANWAKGEYEALVKKSFGGDTDEDAISKYIFSELHGGAKSGADKKHMSGKIDDLVDALIGAPKLLSTFESSWKKQDRMFKSAIDTCKKFENDDNASQNVALAFRNYHSAISQMSKLFNKVTGFAKCAVKEMVGSYMGVVRKALRYKAQKD